MQGNQSKYNVRYEINDLINDAVKNGVARRNQAIDSLDALPALSNEEAGSVAGGQIKLIKPIITGIIASDYPTA